MSKTRQKKADTDQATEGNGEVQAQFEQLMGNFAEWDLLMDASGPDAGDLLLNESTPSADDLLLTEHVPDAGEDLLGEGPGFDWAVPEEHEMSGGQCLVAGEETVLDAALAAAGEQETDEGPRIRLRVDFARKLEMIVRGEAVSTDGTLDAETICALIAWQTTNGLTPNGLVDVRTRTALELHMGANELRLLGDHLEPRTLVPAGVGGSGRYDYYSSVVEEAGGYVDETPGQVNVVGIRGAVIGEDGAIEQNDSAQREAAGAEDHKHFSSEGNTIDDLLVTIWVDDAGTKHVEERRGTVDPNLYWKDEGGGDTEGSAHIRDGQYVYQLGEHSTSHHGGAVKDYVKDGDRAERKRRDAILDPSGGRRVRYAALEPLSLEIIRENPTAEDDHEISTDEFDNSLQKIREGDQRWTDPHDINTNIHTSPEGEASSLGCVNIPLDEDYLGFMEEMQASEEATGSNRMLFTLIDASKVSVVAQRPFFIPLVD